MRKYLLLALLFFFIVLSIVHLQKNDGVSLHAEAQTTNSDWPQFQHDVQHTGRTSLGIGPTLDVAWAWMDKTHIVKNFVSGIDKKLTDGFEAGYVEKTIFNALAQPIVVKGIVYIGSMNGSLYAIDALTGDNRWDFTTGGPILSSVAVDQDIVVVGSMDGKVYGLGAADGVKKWEFTTGEGVFTAPIIANGVIYIGSRDGKFYALDLLTGTQKWAYSTRVEPVDSTSPYNLAPIIAPAALSEDGTTVFFGAENMFVYALNVSNGTEKWAPKKVTGQSFLTSWPVVIGNKLIIRTMSSMRGAEAGNMSPATDFESVLDSLPDSPSWSTEKQAVYNWLAQNSPDNTAQNSYEKTMYVFDVATGQEPYQVAMARVTGENKAPFPPVLDNQGRTLMYWRSRTSTFFTGNTFGSKYCPDLSAMDMNTGDRILLNPTQIQAGCPELDNGFMLSVGGNYLYMGNHFRDFRVLDLTTGVSGTSTATWAKWDCGNSRYGDVIIFYGNDSYSGDTCSPPDPRPDSSYTGGTGHSGVAIATTNGTTMLYMNQGSAFAIVALKKRP